MSQKFTYEAWSKRKHAHLIHLTGTRPLFSVERAPALFALPHASKPDLTYFLPPPNFASQGVHSNRATIAFYSPLTGWCRAASLDMCSTLTRLAIGQLTLKPTDRYPARQTSARPWPAMGAEQIPSRKQCRIQTGWNLPSRCNNAQSLIMHKVAKP